MTFWRNYYHVVWATKERLPLIQVGFEDALFGYLIHKALNTGLYVYGVNGMNDHLHMILAIPPKMSVAQVVKMLKGASSHYVNQFIKPEHLDFAWQRGYGCLTLGEKHRSVAIAYVENQKKHHEEQTTNAWLERYDIQDEGPIDHGILSIEDPGIIREEKTVYEAISDPWLF